MSAAARRLRGMGAEAARPHFLLRRRGRPYDDLSAAGGGVGGKQRLSGFGP